MVSKLRRQYFTKWNYCTSKYYNVVVVVVVVDDDDDDDDDGNNNNNNNNDGGDYIFWHTLCSTTDMSTYATPALYDKHVISELCALFMPMTATSYLVLSTAVGRAVCCSSRCLQFINIGDFPSSSTLPSSMQDTEAANPYVNMIVCSVSVFSLLVAWRFSPGLLIPGLKLNVGSFWV